MTDEHRLTVKEWGAGRVAFLAQLDELRKLVADGWPILNIYRKRQATLAGISYRQFLSYVHQYIGGTTNEANEPGTRVGRSSRRARAPLAPDSGGSHHHRDDVPPGSSERTGDRRQEGGGGEQHILQRADLAVRNRSMDFRDSLDPDPTIDAEKKREKYC